MRYQKSFVLLSYLFMLACGGGGSRDNRVDGDDGRGKHPPHVAADAAIVLAFNGLGMHFIDRLISYWVAIYFGFIILFSTHMGWACPFELPTVQATLKGHEIFLELATTPETRACGLSHREYLPANRGMLFVYPEPEILTFWMKDTRIPLSIAFIDAAGRIVSIQKMNPFPITADHVSPLPARYALEVNQGWFEVNSVGTGIVFTFELPPTLEIR